uniref:Uncharacterized protein n=1 Tax=Micrurus carvalhoi TaxID=3147026 RepID=A0A2H6NGW5_9SAUR
MAYRLWKGHSKYSSFCMEAGNLCCRMLFLFLTQRVGQCSNALGRIKTWVMSWEGKQKDAILFQMYRLFGLLKSPGTSECPQLVFNNFAIKGCVCVHVGGLVLIEKDS